MENKSEPVGEEIAEAAVLKDLTKLRHACKCFIEKVSKKVQNKLKKKLCPRAADDLFSAEPSIQSEKRRRRF